MKTSFIICLFGLTFFSVQSNDIPLRSKLADSGKMSNEPQTYPVEACQSTASVVISFSANLENLEVMVENQFGTVVFQTEVNVTNGDSITINTVNWSSGMYTLLIANGAIVDLEGSFAIKRK